MRVSFGFARVQSREFLALPTLSSIDIVLLRMPVVETIQFRPGWMNTTLHVVEAWSLPAPAQVVP